jgi:hypothetical protein
MSKLKNIHRDPPTKHQEAQLVAWLNEWALYLELHAIDAATREKERWAGTTPVDVIPAAGQIRLLPPVSTALRSRPVYVAVFQSEHDNCFLVAPYGRFAVPATPGELSTGRECAAVRVLCLWNARGLPADVLKSTWLVDDMTSRELSEAMAVHRNLKKRTGLPEGLDLRIGPPIFHPADPRRIYINREDAFWDAVLSETCNLPRDLSLTYLLWMEEPRGRREMRIAAEEGAVYAVAKRFSVDNSDAVIVVSFDDEDRTCRFRVQTAEDEPCAKLDACRIETPGGEVCTIEDCRAAMKADHLREGFCITDLAGRPLVLHPLN